MFCIPSEHVWTRCGDHFNEYIVVEVCGDVVVVLNSIGYKVSFKTEELIRESPYGKFVRAATVANKFVWAKKSHDSFDFAHGFLMKDARFHTKNPQDRRVIFPDEEVSFSPVHTMGVVDDFVWSVTRNKLMVVQLNPNPWEHAVISMLCPLERVSLDALRLLHPRLSTEIFGFTRKNK